VTVARDPITHRPSVLAYGWAVVIAALALTGIGVIMVYSTSAVAAARHPHIQDPEFYLRRQLVWTGFALAVMAVLTRVSFRWWGRHGRSILAVAGVLLVLVLVAGREWHGARRWIRFLGYGFQPSEVAKLAVVAFVGGEICRQGERLREWRGFLSVFAPLGLIMGLILVEPDFGTTLFVGALGISLLLVGGVRPNHLVGTFAALVPPAALLAAPRLAHVADRVRFFLGDEPHYQVRQSLLALGSGGLLGRGLGAGRAKLGFLPESSTDFIFSIVGEEMGFVGTLLVILLFGAFVWCGMRIALDVVRVSRFGFFLTVGLVLMVGLQGVINIAVVTASAPTKGIALPFLSQGGSSILVFLGGTGILFNVARTCHRERSSEILDPSEARPW
jgi:cell division protein FtsW